MPELDIPEPFTGVSLWAPRVGSIAAFCGVLLFAVSARDPSVLLLLPFLLLFLTAFEILIRARAARRRYAFLHGETVQATILTKRETLRGPESKLRIRYSINNHTIESEQAVSPQTYARISVGQTIQVRVAPGRPLIWVPT